MTQYTCNAFAAAKQAALMSARVFGNPGISGTGTLRNYRNHRNYRNSETTGTFGKYKILRNRTNNDTNDDSAQIFILII